jgi:hypothetical protein
LKAAQVPQSLIELQASVAQRLADIGQRLDRDLSILASQISQLTQRLDHDVGVAAGQISQLAERLDKAIGRLDLDITSLGERTQKLEAALAPVMANLTGRSDLILSAILENRANGADAAIRSLPAVQILEPLSADESYFCITHSDRPTALDKCDLNYLEMRFARRDRLPPKEPFKSLTPAKDPYGGEVTIYSIGAEGRDTPRLIARFRPHGFKPAHATWRNGRLWITATAHIEVYDEHLKSIARIDDPWLAGLHTIIPDGCGRMLVSCAASDSVIIIDEQSMSVSQAIRLPEKIYGRNYALSRADSVVDHYITNDLQITHVNCAAPWRGGIVTSSLIPGAIGWFDEDGHYSELVRGFVGCHGVRASSTGELYFSDSCVGTVVFLSPEMRVKRRLRTESFWLHDAVEVAPELFALALFDKKEVRFIDATTRNMVYCIDCTEHGGPQFLAF